MPSYLKMKKEELRTLKAEFEIKYKEMQSKSIDLDISRGKPSNAQLNLSMDMLKVFDNETELISNNSIDCRNYGVIDGIPEAKKLIGDLLNVDAKHILIYGNSSSSIMFDIVSHSMTKGVLGNPPWSELDKIKFLCPVPGFDRHFLITEYFGIEMIPIPMTINGPDMDIVEQLVSEDDTIKGIWCVPKYSNPQGISYSDVTIRRFAKLKPAANDFRIYWDNAYVIHDLYETQKIQILEILAECKQAGNADMVYEFCSTSKISFPGAGVAALATSVNNLEEIKNHLKIQTIGHDKLNQLRHVRFYKDLNGLNEHMKKHADILRPKFEMISDILDRELSNCEIGSWTIPKGGYFISFDSMENCAKAIVAKASNAGLKMTPAGITYPYGIDLRDSNIRIAPSYPSLEDMKIAVELFVLCVKLISIDKLLGISYAKKK